MMILWILHSWLPLHQEQLLQLKFTDIKYTAVKFIQGCVFINHIQTILAMFINLLIPGAGLVYLGKYLLGVYVQIALLFTLLLFSYTKIVFEPSGVIALVSSLVTISMLSSFNICLINQKKKELASLKNAIAAFTFSISFLMIFVFSLLYKDKVFGIDLNYVPTDSMAPTLIGGDFILVDTRAYRNKPAEKNNIVVFTPPQTTTLFVKRVVEAKPALPALNSSYFMMGDNRKHSLDSRDFGEIKHSSISGQAKIIIFNKKTSTSGTSKKRLLIPIK